MERGSKDKRQVRGEIKREVDVDLIDDGGGWYIWLHTHRQLSSKPKFDGTVSRNDLSFSWLATLFDEL